MTTTTIRDLRERAAPWLHRPAPPPRQRTIDSADRADWAMWEHIRHECTALAQLDYDLHDEFGATDLVRDVWMAAYAREPELRDPTGDPEPAQRVNRAITAAMLGSPEHTELRAATTADAYAAAMSVLARAAALRKMLRRLDPAQQQHQAQRAQQDAAAAAERVADAFDAAQRAAGLPGDHDDTDQAKPDHADEPAEDQDAGEQSPVPRPELVDVQRAMINADVADRDAELAQQTLAELAAGDETGEQGANAVRATARQACAEAADALDTETTTMTSWGIDPGARERLDPDTRMKLARTLQTGKLRRFADLVGRFQMMAQAQRARRVEHARTEYVGVTLGDDLTSLIPSELVNLAVPALRAQFAIRYAEKQLMVYDQRGEDHQGQGAIIVCVDCSGSMRAHGRPGEAYAKAFALALLEQARHATPTRDYSAVLFARKVDTVLTFPADQPVNPVHRIQLASDFTGGGTEFAPPLTAATTLLEREYNTTSRQRADIVFITDGAAKLSEQWLERWHEQKRHLGFRCFGVRVGDWAEEQGAQVLDTFCDDVRHLQDLTDPHGTADLFRAI